MDLPRSNYYYRPVDRASKQKDDTSLRDRMEQLALRFPRYGYRRMTAQLRRDGLKVNHKRVLRIMRQSDLLCKRRRRFVSTTESDHARKVYPNLYRNRVPTAINRVWVADITYIRLATGFVYLAAVLDACSRKVVGWSLSRHIDADLASSALHMAIASRRPPAGCIHHSDRGVQYASQAYTELLKDHGFEISMSRKGNPCDNAQAESFFKTLKSEEVDLTEYGAMPAVRRRIDQFIGQIYNKERLHSALGYVSPEEFEIINKQPEKDVLTLRVVCPA